MTSTVTVAPKDGTEISGDKRKIGRKGRKIIVVSSVIISLMVIAATWAYIMVLGIGVSCGCIVPTISAVKSSNADNWTWTVTAVGGGGVLKGDVFVQLKNASGFVIENEQLTVASGTHGFNYMSASQGDFIIAGDVLTLSKNYATGSMIILVTEGLTGQYAILTA